MKKYFFIIIAWILPIISFAQTGVYSVPSNSTSFPTNGTLTDIINWILHIFNLIIPLLIGLAVLLFLWGAVKFIYKADSEEGRTDGRNFMIYGIIGIAVMVSVWGLVAFLTNTFGFSFGIPQLPVK